MKKFYIIIVSPEINSQLIRERIKMIGPHYVIWDNQWIVCSKERAKEIYERISADEFSHILIFISELNIENYYGRMMTSLWEWIKNQNDK